PGLCSRPRLVGNRLSGSRRKDFLQLARFHEFAVFVDSVFAGITALDLSLPELPGCFVLLFSRPLRQPEHRDDLAIAPGMPLVHIVRCHRPISGLADDLGIFQPSASSPRRVKHRTSRSKHPTKPTSLTTSRNPSPTSDQLSRLIVSDLRGRTLVRLLLGVDHRVQILIWLLDRTHNRATSAVLYRPSRSKSSHVRGEIWLRDGLADRLHITNKVPERQNRPVNRMNRGTRDLSLSLCVVDLSGDACCDPRLRANRVVQRL